MDFTKEKILETLHWYSNMEIQDLVLQKTEVKSNISISEPKHDKQTMLNELRIEVEKFDGCNIKKTANSTVFAEGNIEADVMLIGEAPGATEDAEGVPFCGASGKLLDVMLASIGLSRKTNAYITNSVFWRPPANRRPTTEELELCKPYLERHIAIIKPKLLILVGSTAVESILGKQHKISEIRKNYLEYNNQYLKQPITTTAIFHPAYLLRQPIQKKTSWYDLLKIQKQLDTN